MDQGVPEDRWNVTYMILLLHGIGNLIAWNTFITAKNYFEKYKLGSAPELAQYYLSYVGWASHLPNLFFTWLNVFMRIGGKLSTRIAWSISAELLLFIFTIILAMSETSPYFFFWATMITVFLLNSMNAIYQNSVYGVAAFLPPKYTGAVVLGNNICGTLVVFLIWATQFFDRMRTSATYYFLAAIVMLLACLDTYFALPLNRFYRYYEVLNKNSKTVEGAIRNIPPYRTIVKQAFTQLYNIFIIFFVTLSVYPSVVSEISPVSVGFLGNNFTLVTCFLTFNVMAMVGNLTANRWQVPSSRWLALFTSIRILFIPIFVFCNYKVDKRTLPVLVKSDVLYWLMLAILAWSSGHGSTLGMMYVCGTVPPEHASTAGMIGAAMIITGIVIGITFSSCLPTLVSLDF